MVRFTAGEPGAATFIDLVAPAVHEIVLNGTQVDLAEAFADSRIALTGLAAENELRVVADCAYSNTGEGLHRFVDPVDKRDLPLHPVRGPGRPAGVRLVRAARPQGRLHLHGDRAARLGRGLQRSHPGAGRRRRGTQVWNFAPTRRISTYITALVAGPYVGVFDEYTEGGQSVPLGIYCRPSLEEFLDAEAIFDVTKQGFEYFQEKFDTPTRSRSTTSCSYRSSTRARWRTPAR